MVIFDIVEKLNPDVFLITLNKEGKRIFDGRRNTYINYAKEDILSAEIQELNTSQSGAIIVTVN